MSIKNSSQNFEEETTIPKDITGRKSRYSDTGLEKANRLADRGGSYP